MFGNQVSTGAQVRWNPSVSSMCLFLHLLRFEVVGIGVNLDQPRNLIHIQVGKRADVVAAEGAPH